MFPPVSTTIIRVVVTSSGDKLLPSNFLACYQSINQSINQLIVGVSSGTTARSTGDSQLMSNK